MSEEKNGMSSNGKDSKPTPGWTIFWMGILGLLLVAIVLIILVCWVDMDKTQIPWLLLPGIAAAPSLMLIWHWRVVHKRKDIEKGEADIEIAREGQITERFTRAIELLGSGKMAVRLGAIYALERISKDSKKDHWTIVETLAAFIRENAPWPPKKAEDTLDKGKKPANDVQAALTVLGRRKWREDEPGYIDLSFTALMGANLMKAHLERAYLRDSHLEGAIFLNAHLDGAYLREAHLVGAYLMDAHLMGADLREADFKVSILSGADLRATNLSGADLTGAHLTTTDLSGSIYDKKTIFPKGFDPEAEGMTRESSFPLLS